MTFKAFIPGIGLAWCLALSQPALGADAPGAATKAEAPELIPAEVFAERPKMAGLRFSRNGKRFAVLQEFRGRRNLFVADLDNKAEIKPVTNFQVEGDVGGYAWIGNDRLVFFLTDLGRGLAEQRGGGMFIVNADGSGGKQIASTVQNCIDNLEFACRETRFWKTIKGNDNEVIVLSNDRSQRSPDLYRLDMNTGRKTLITGDNPGQVEQWVLDKDDQPRAALSHDGKKLVQKFWYRDSATSPWREVLSYSSLGAGMAPIAFAADGTLYVSSTRKTDTAAIYKFDPKTNAEGERIAFHPTADIGMLADTDRSSIGAPSSPLILDPETSELIGVAIDADKPEVYWLRADEERVQRAIDGALPGAINQIRKLPEKRYFIRSHSDRDPGTYYLFDSAKGRLEEIARVNRRIDPKKMGRTEVVRYKARDGLEIPAYLTLPPGREAKNLPLVTWIHGGPWARDDWGWEYEVQFMATRGYAVLQPNYRGSIGFGRKHFESSFKKLGQSMQDDVSDGVDHLVAQGIVDPKRVCIGGGSYGGYATMMGLVKEPTRYRCGIDIVGVTDLFWWLELGYTDFNLFDAEGSAAWLTRTIGDPSQDAEMMRTYSPRLHADKVQAPVLFIEGGGDMRVPVKHAEAMRDGLKSLGKPFEWVIYPEEGHGFMKESNRIDYLRHLESFLTKHLGPAR